MNFLTAAPLPDEFIAGHIGRLRLINGFDTSAQLFRALDHFHRGGIKDGSPAPIYKLISDFIGLDSAEYVRQHSMLPFNRVAAQNQQETCSFAKVASAQQRSALVHERGGAYYCVNCVDIDRVPYWRRVHQLPGMYVCPDHGNALSYVTDKAAFEYSPCRWIGNSHQVSHDLEALHAHPVVARYTKIALRFLADGKRTCRFTASCALGNSMRKVGLRIGIVGVRPTLSDYIKQHLPITWLCQIWPELAVKSAGSQFVPIDGACRSQVSHGVTYAVALAALFDDSKHGLSEFFRPLSEQVKEKWKPPLTTGQRLRREILPIYLKTNGSLPMIAKEMDINYDALLRRTRRAGLPRLFYTEESHRREILDFLATASIEDIDAWATKYEKQ